jgi:tetratricopeptide (TPR) repeat protein
MNAGYARAAREQLLQIDPDRGEMRGWSPYWTQRVHAAYLIGNHAEERDAAREMARRHPDRRVALVLEARAMASQHDLRALDSALVAWDSLPTNVYWSQGAAMVVAAEELMRRGHDADGRRYAQRAVAWLSNRLVATPNDRAHRYWMGSVLYDMGEFQGARPYFEGLAREFPDRLLYSGLSAVVAARRGDGAAANRWLVTAPARQTGDRLAYQARIAAIAGDTEQAVVLLTSAVEHGVEGYAWFPGAAFRDLAALANDPRGRALLNGR